MNDSVNETLSLIKSKVAAGFLEHRPSRRRLVRAIGRTRSEDQQRIARIKIILSDTKETVDQRELAAEDRLSKMWAMPRGTPMTSRMKKLLGESVTILEPFLGRDSRRILGYLDANKIVTLKTLLYLTSKKMKEWDGWGPRQMESVYQALEHFGFVRYNKLA